MHTHNYFFYCLKLPCMLLVFWTLDKLWYLSLIFSRLQIAMIFGKTLFSVALQVCVCVCSEGAEQKTTTITIIEFRVCALSSALVLRGLQRLLLSVSPYTSQTVSEMHHNWIIAFIWLMDAVITTTMPKTTTTQTTITSPSSSSSSSPPKIPL